MGQDDLIRLDNVTKTYQAGVQGPQGSPPALADLTVGDALPPLTYRVTRKQLVQYAGAAGDFNAIHWNQRVAVDVGAPEAEAAPEAEKVSGAQRFGASRTDVDSPWVNWTADSIRKTTGKAPAILPNFGGSLPNDVFSDALGLPTIWVPHSYPACSQHAPDERGLARRYDPLLRELTSRLSSTDIPEVLETTSSGQLPSFALAAQGSRP